MTTKQKSEEVAARNAAQFRQAVMELRSCIDRQPPDSTTLSMNSEVALYRLASFSLRGRDDLARLLVDHLQRSVPPLEEAEA